MPPKKSNRKSYKKFPEGPTVHKSPLDKGKAPLDLATLGAFSEVLRTLATEPRLAAHKTRLIKAAEAYESMMDETAANAEEERSWAYYKEIKADLRQRVGQLKRRQAIGYAEIHGDTPATFLLIWDFDKPVSKAQWITDHDEDEDSWNELANHLFNEMTHFGPGFVTRHSNPPLALLSGLEDVREEMLEKLVALIKAKKWEIAFDEQDP